MPYMVTAAASQSTSGYPGSAGSPAMMNILVWCYTVLSINYAPYTLPRKFVAGPTMLPASAPFSVTMMAVLQPPVRKSSN